jgi:exopolysaccharide biosynthesis polyprenyl glycosylphosphotransferase
MSHKTEIGPAGKAFQYFLRLTDVVALEVAYYLAYLTVPIVRRSLFPGLPVSYSADVTLSTALLIPLVWLLLIQVRSLYGDPAQIPYMRILGRFLQITFFGLGLVTLILFTIKQENLSRLLLFIFGVYSYCILVAKRIVEKWYFLARHRGGRYSEKLAIVGSSSSVRKILLTIEDFDALRSCQVVGYFNNGSDENLTSGVPYLGPIANIGTEIVKRQVGEVLIVLDSLGLKERDHILEVCCRLGRRARIIPEFALPFESGASQIMSSRPEGFWGLPSIVVSTVQWKSEQEFVKRLIDIVGSATLLILLSPLLALIAMAVKLSSPGPILYRWRVLGRNNREFVGYKFRTMLANADEMKSALMAFNEMTGPVFKIKKDPRVTRLGRILRKFSLDELPQLWSVLRGDMSLVGPRPPSPSEFERFEFWQMRKLSIRPGMTCLWQVHGRNDIRDFDEWVKLDLRYIDHWSLWLDFRILLRTAWVVIAGTGS